MHAHSVLPGNTDTLQDRSALTPSHVAGRDLCDLPYDRVPADHRWPPLVRVCVTIGCGVLAWATLLAPAWYLLSS